ncbi:MAG: hypothetical protein R3190_06125 [Thermoanaerobaculia bacterium]|nr:hypothetical protein [Thermoanaerobaculia bacterium]
MAASFATPRLGVLPGLALALLACGGAGTESAPAPTAAAPPTQAEAADATYRGLFDDPVTLSSGSWEGEPLVAGAASRPHATLAESPSAVGELDATAPAERVVVVVADGGGSGSFVHLAVLGRRDGVVNLATTRLGDRVRVEGLAVRDGSLQVELLLHDGDDPLCCPTVAATRTYGLAGDRLLPVADLAALPADAWPRFLVELLPAIDSCLDAVPGAVRVARAWPMNRGKAGVRVELEGGAHRQCIADLADAQPPEVATESATAAAAGRASIVFTRGRAAPPAGECFEHELVVVAGRPAGTLSFDTC